tara:strand:- start:325 stop:1581 length:1257 start_codon:yes stop_codon:yes gene_type:complete
MHYFKRIGAYAICSVLLLSGCVTNEKSFGNKNFTESIIGPALSSFFDPKRIARVDPNKTKLEVIVPIFDPGLSKKAEEYKEEGVWPELRRAEANRFAYKLKTALEDTNAFGAVRVTPDKSATGDLYVLGKIVESNGETIEINIQVVDISGKNWFTRTFERTVEPQYYKNIRNKGKDPYDPVFEEASNRIALELENYKTEQLETLTRVADLRFGASFSDAAFSEYIAVENGRVKLASFPSEDDPMLKRTRAIRVRDQLFVDGLQDEYRSFSDNMGSSYLIWQEQSLLEIQAKQDAQLKAAGEAVMGIAAIALAVAAVAAGSDPNYSPGTSTAAMTGGIVAGAAGISMLQKSFQTSDEAKVHRDTLNEVGESINVDLAPRVIAFEEKTLELTGDAKQQFSQWREFLQQIYAQELTPEKQL